MSVLTTLLWIVCIMDSILLVLIVLLQSGRGGGLSGMLGGGGAAEAAIGPKTGLPKITAWMAAVFFVSLTLIGVVTRKRSAGSLKKAGGKKPPAEAPASPGEKQTPKAAPATSTPEAETKS